MDHFNRQLKEHDVQTVINQLNRMEKKYKSEYQEYKILKVKKRFLEFKKISRNEEKEN